MTHSYAQTPMDIFLDIETDWQRRLTVLGFCSAATGIVQLIGDDITLARLRRELPPAGCLFTYNGHSFDLTCIQKQLGVSLRQEYQSLDLRWVCQRHGLRGGQKRIEQQLGIPRRLPDLDGRDALVLWQRYRGGDVQALDTLLEYNREDLAGLIAIRDHLRARQLL